MAVLFCSGKDEYMSNEQLGNTYGEFIHRLSRKTSSSVESKNLVEDYFVSKNIMGEYWFSERGRSR